MLMMAARRKLNDAESGEQPIYFIVLIVWWFDLFVASSTFNYLSFEAVYK